MNSENKIPNDQRKNRALIKSIKSLSVLLIEDNENDVELIKYEIKRRALKCDLIHVSTKEQFLKKIIDQTFDIILSDYNLPQLTGQDIINILIKKQIETPVIIVTGSINEEIAVEAIKSGASDYILKTNLSRLVPAINSAIEKSKIQKEKEKLENELKQNKEMLSLILNSTEDCIMLFDTDCKIIYFNSAPVFGYKNEDVAGKFPNEIFDEALAWQIEDSIKKVIAEKKTILTEEEYKIHHKIESFSVERSPVFDSNGEVIAVSSFARNITGKKIIEDALKKSEEKHKVIFNNASDSIIICDLNGKILDVNKVCAQALEYSKEELLNKNLLDLISPIYYSYLNDKLSNLKKHGSVTFELVHVTKQGKIIPIESRSKIIEYENQKVVISIIRDITERKKYESDLRTAKEKAEVADKLKSEFLAQMSHEIRTPINNILSFSELIKEELDEIITDELKTSFEIINRAGGRIIRTIDLLLHMSELQTGSYEYCPEKIDVYSEILEKLFIEFSIYAIQKGLDIKIFKNTSNTELIIDEKSVYQIFSNLIDNAIKYTPEGFVHISIGKTEKNKIYVDIADSGIGISKEYLPDLFTPFTQEEQGYTRKFEGNGLGLALVKKYVELNSAEIEIQSIKGKGTTVRIIFKNN